MINRTQQTTDSSLFLRKSHHSFQNHHQQEQDLSHILYCDSDGNDYYCKRRKFSKENSPDESLLIDQTTHQRCVQNSGHNLIVKFDVLPVMASKEWGFTGNTVKQIKVKDLLIKNDTNNFEQQHKTKHIENTGLFNFGEQNQNAAHSSHLRKRGFDKRGQGKYFANKNKGRVLSTRDSNKVFALKTNNVQLSKAKQNAPIDKSFQFMENKDLTLHLNIDFLKLSL